jgi:acetyltransferase-like isoleucine patch superfamily enzyme
MAIQLTKMMTVGILPSFLKKTYYRILGAKIGKNVSIGLFSIINAKSIEIGDDVKISPLCFLNVRNLKLGNRVKINSFVAMDTGDVTIDDDSLLMEQIVIGGMLTPQSSLFIGKRVKIFPYCFINPTKNITIEDDVGIGGATYIFTHGSWQSKLDGFPISFGPVTIKRGVWFPWRVFVMPNVTVGEFATIGAGSTITKDIPARSLAVGSPAKVIKTGNEYVKSFTLEEKTKMVRDILSELSEYLNYLGHESEIKTAGEETRVTVINNKKLLSASFSNSFGKPPDADVFLSIVKIPDEFLKELKQRGTIWFDIESRLCSMKSDFLGDMLKNFLSRYGIRFEPVS